MQVKFLCSLAWINLIYQNNKHFEIKKAKTISMFLIKSTIFKVFYKITLQLLLLVSPKRTAIKISWLTNSQTIDSHIKWSHLTIKVKNPIKCLYFLNITNTMITVNVDIIIHKHNFLYTTILIFLLQNIFNEC